ncbi:MAG: Gfo/Idh/MocA family oxidoreductase [Pyrinomonadaceae bacterium]|nr:Gfo/Idh/MocA family oxidoreductase [Pyrinomonadaceae bacterium]
MNDLSIGIVGLGWVAGAHIEAFKKVEGARVTAVCSRRELDGAQLERQYGLPLKSFQDYTAMLGDPEIDVIDICTPHPLHPEQAIAAAQAGKHLIIEKPISLTFEDAKRMRAAIREAGVKTCVCFEVRYSQHGTLIRSTIDQGLLGNLHYGEVDYYHGIGPWYGQFGWNVKKELGGSSLLTAGCHALDLLLFYMDSEVEEVTSYSTRTKSSTFEPYEYDTTSVTILKFKDGKIGKVASVVDCFQPYYFHIHLVGSEGSLLDNRIYSERLKGLTKKRWSTLETPLIDSGDVADHPYQPQFQAFIDSVKKNEPMPLTDFDSAFETHRVIFAADLSAAEGRPVKLSELAT